jgi:SAM-dependent methyltransferase
VSNFLQTIAQKLQWGDQPRHDRIDVKRLIGQLGDAELLAAADAYFAGLTVTSEQCYKPFSNVTDAIHITRNLSLLLQAADVFRGADVLDFGCATGWLSLALADLGCSVLGVDISPAALRLAETWCAQRGVRAGGAVQFQAYDGHRLPLADNSVDRVVCFDAFHHVKDQAATLKELARVLRPGGRIAMLEPGPRHSQTPQSQAEMAQYKVIENDIVMADIAAGSAAAGLAVPRVLVQMNEPREVSLDQYQQWSSSSGLPKRDGAALLRALHRCLTDTQCFYMSKPGAGALVDSRRLGALAAKIQLESAKPVHGENNLFELQFRLRNTGEAVWISQQGALGQVNLGCQLLQTDNTVQNLDFQRFSLGATDVRPGETRELWVRVRIPFQSAAVFRFDLVAEHTAWFAQGGRCKPVTWRSDNPA